MVPVVAVRVAVIGVGHLGKHHARILAAMPGVQLVGIVDTNLGRVTEIASEYGTRPSMDPAEWVLAAEERHAADAQNAYELSFRRYERAHE